MKKLIVLLAIIGYAHQANAEGDAFVNESMRYFFRPQYNMGYQPMPNGPSMDSLYRQQLQQMQQQRALEQMYFQRNLNPFNEDQDS